MKLYSGPLSLFTAKVRIALDEKGLDYELVSVPFSRAGYQPKHPTVLELNPKAQVPVLVENDVAIYDSTIIFEYLEDTHPLPALYPSEPSRRARCRVMEAAADEIFFPFVWELIREVFYKPDGGGRDEAAVAAARTGIVAHYDGLERRIGDAAHLCGEFSVADIGYFMTATFAASLGAPIGESTPRLRAWYDRVRTRPAVTKELTGLAAASERVASA
jgi:glutathione S-transferase